MPVIREEGREELNESKSGVSILSVDAGRTVNRAGNSDRLNVLKLCH